MAALKFSCVPMTEDEIVEHQNAVEWFTIFEKQKLSEGFIRKFYNKVNVDFLASNDKNAVEKAIRANLTLISHYQVLSEVFIREFQDILCWDNIFWYQNLSSEFIKEFSHKN